jgi:hypothetical protein
MRRRKVGGVSEVDDGDGRPCVREKEERMKTTHVLSMN